MFQPLPLHSNASLTRALLCCNSNKSFHLKHPTSFLIFHISVIQMIIIYPKMKFWEEEKDCCSWDGVTCDVKTSQVVGLNLSYSCLQWPLRSKSSLFKLHGLQQIKLAFNNFSFCHIPSEFGRLSRLTHLVLSYSMFSGKIPSEISCLPNLVYLDLSSFMNYDYTSFLYFKRVDFSKFTHDIFKGTFPQPSQPFIINSYIPDKFVFLEISLI